MAAENDILKAFGGKGANQAIACARLCENTKIQMLGQVGKDAEGEAYLKYLAENNVDATLVRVKEDQVTG